MECVEHLLCSVHALNKKCLQDLGPVFFGCLTEIISAVFNFLFISSCITHVGLDVGQSSL